MFDVHIFLSAVNQVDYSPNGKCQRVLVLALCLVPTCKDEHDDDALCLAPLFHFLFIYVVISVFAR